MSSLTRRQFLTSLAAALFTQAHPRLTQIRNKADWQQVRAEILAGMQAVMGPLPMRTQAPVEIITQSSEDLPAFTLNKITYLSEPGDFVPAYLLVPKRRKRHAPAMLCLHQTVKIGKAEPVGLGGNTNLHYAKELAERGYVCLVPDYPYLGENAFAPYAHGYASCTMKGIVNHRRAVDLLQALPYVDRQRIGAIGHSLGGHNTLFVAAFDERIKAMVTSCGFTSMRKYKNGDLTGWEGQRYMPLIAQKYGKDPARLPFDFPDILVALAPRPLFINAPLHDDNFEVSGVRDCVAIAAPVYEKVFKAKECLLAVYPDVGHEFPGEIRRQAYEFLGRWLHPL